MNGFVNTLLSVMLSWIRALISQIWRLLTSEDGGVFYQFLSANWLKIVIVLCAVCMLVDVIVYFFRWRPDYVWASKWRRLRRKRPGSAEEPEMDAPPQEAFYTYAPDPEPQPEPEPAAPTTAYAPLQRPTIVYAPVMQPTQTWQVQDVEDPALDDDALWDSEEPMEIEWEPADEAPAFGAVQPEPLTYFRDVQAGFAPAVPPEQLYAPPARRRYQPETEPAAVHPGLDEDIFRQNLGLKEDSAPASSPVMRAPAFRPFTASYEPEPEKTQGTFQRFAQRARDFMALDDEPKTIRDLQSSVDVSKAFHEPVYPQSFQRDEE